MKQRGEKAEPGHRKRAKKKNAIEPDTTKSISVVPKNQRSPPNESTRVHAISYTYTCVLVHLWVLLLILLSGHAQRSGSQFPVSLPMIHPGVSMELSSLAPFCLLLLHFSFPGGRNTNFCVFSRLISCALSGSYSIFPLIGDAGTGKTVFASALYNSERIRNTFFGGCYWISYNRYPGTTPLPLLPSFGLHCLVLPKLLSSEFLLSTGWPPILLPVVNFFVRLLLKQTLSAL